MDTTSHYSQQVTITNTSMTAISGKLYLVFDNLMSGVTLNNKSGVTANVSPLGISHMLLSLGSATTLGAGKSVSIMLDWINATGKAISYHSRLLSGRITP